MAIVERFRDRLEGLEFERLKVVRDRQTYRFLSALLGFLATCSLAAGLYGRSPSVLVLGTLLALLAFAVWHYRKNLSEAYQIRFRDGVTREWFSERFRSAYLAPAPSETTAELTIAIREAAIRATNQSPKRTVIEERILFDRDSYTSLVFILREGSLLKPKSRALVWCKLRSSDDGVVAFVWPPALATQKSLDIRFFKDGKRTSVIEPLATRLEHLYDTAQRLAPGSTPRVGYAPRGIFLGCRLERRLFEAPVQSSLLNESSYASWETDAQLPLSLELRNEIGSLF